MWYTYFIAWRNGSEIGNSIHTQIGPVPDIEDIIRDRGWPKDAVVTSINLLRRSLFKPKIRGARSHGEQEA